MESKPDCSESVLLKLTSEPLWAIMDEHLSTPLPLPLTVRLLRSLLSSAIRYSSQPMSHPSSVTSVLAGLGHSFKHNGNSGVENE